MKIGLVTGEYPPMPGGVGDFSRILAEQMCELGHEVHVFSRSGTTSKTLPVSTTDTWGPGCLTQIRSWARRRELNVINLQFQTAAFNMSPFVHFLPRFVDVPLITTFHDLRFPYLFPKAGRLRNWIVMQLARLSSGVITTNHEDDQRLRSLQRRRLIPIGSNIRARTFQSTERDMRRQQIGATDSSFLLGHFGFITESKGVDFLIEAAARLRSAGQEIRLVFIGARRNTVDADRPADYLRSLDERLASLGLAEAAHWTGYLPDAEVAAWLNAVDLITLPFNDGASFRRGSLIAAIHNGCAILSTEPAVAIDRFKHGCNLWLVPRGSAGAIEDAVLHLIRDREQLASLREGARRLSKHFDWDFIARSTVAFYETCL